MKAHACSGQKISPVHIVSDSQLPCAGDNTDTQLPCPPEELLKTDVARETLKRVEEKESSGVEEARPLCLSVLLGPRVAPRTRAASQAHSSWIETPIHVCMQLFLCSLLASLHLFVLIYLCFSSVCLSIYRCKARGSVWIEAAKGATAAEEDFPIPEHDAITRRKQFRLKGQKKVAKEQLKGERKAEKERKKAEGPKKRGRKPGSGKAAQKSEPAKKRTKAETVKPMQVETPHVEDKTDEKVEHVSRSTRCSSSSKGIKRLATLRNTAEKLSAKRKARAMVAEQPAEKVKPSSEKVSDKGTKAKAQKASKAKAASPPIRRIPRLQRPRRRRLSLARLRVARQPETLPRLKRQLRRARM